MGGLVGIWGWVWVFVMRMHTWLHTRMSEQIDLDTTNYYPRLRPTGQSPDSQRPVLKRTELPEQIGTCDTNLITATKYRVRGTRPNLRGIACVIVPFQAWSKSTPPHTHPSPRHHTHIPFCPPQQGSHLIMNGRC